jgi:hypothetical protein
MTSFRRQFLILAIILAAHALVLAVMGRVFWCAQGDLALWKGDAWSNHTSQHLFDPYSFSHLQHGIFFFFLFFLCRVPPRRGFWIACFLEIGWEILENSSIIIERYRAATASRGYFGDSIMNSEGDIICCLLGFALAAKLPWQLTLCAYVLIELGMVYVIRDSLSLNALMLIRPVAAIRNWQTAVPR